MTAPAIGGCVVVDYETHSFPIIINGGVSGLYETFIKNGNKSDNYAWLKTLDNWFREPNEVPKDYKWDIGEFEGWLQFRWGDGKNAVGYVEPEPEPKPIKKKPVQEPAPIEEAS